MLSPEPVMGVLRTTVPRLHELIESAPEAAIYAVTDYGWSVNKQLAHLRACHDVLGGNMLRIVSEDHPAWKAVSPGARLRQSDYFEWNFGPAFEAFGSQRAELLEVVDPLSPRAWEGTATVSVPPGKAYEYSTLYYGDWKAQ